MGVVADYGYDTLNRLTSINHHTGVSVLASFDYALDNAGNRIGVTEADGSQFQWGYDDAYRLLTETRYNASGGATYNAVFTYDAMGNRLSETENNTRTDYTYNNLDQLVSSITDSVVTDYTYNPRGNLTTVTTDLATTSYTWDARDRMTAVGLPDGSAVSYVYDADNQRVQENVAGEVTNYLWDSESVYGDVVVEYDATNGVQTDYTLAGMRLISQHQDSSTHFYHADGQNSTRVLSNGSNTVANEYTYKAFGEMLTSDTSIANRYLYTGQQFDTVTGQYSLRARYYDTGVGRFSARDKFNYETKNPLELNRYAYVANNPVRFSDPSGFTLTGRSITDSIVGSIAQAKATVIGFVARNQLLSLMSAALVLANVVFFASGSNNNCNSWTDWIPPFNVSDDSTGHVHHIATDKHPSRWTPLLEPMFIKANLNIRTTRWNLIRIAEHVGRHRNVYHTLVYNRLRAIQGKCDPYRHALQRELWAMKIELVTRYTPLRNALLGVGK